MPTVKFGEVGIMAWGLFFMAWSPLFPVKGNVNATACKDILENLCFQLVFNRLGKALFVFCMTAPLCTKLGP